ncbi:MAG: leucine-rich repeat protein [Clostridia bacterium]|nr:leucine-rich repeat protein [Clostridia bacterium]
MKKVLSMVLVWVMVLTLIPLGVVTASAETTSGTTGDCTWTLVDGVLTISGNGVMADYSYSDKAPWDNYYSQIKEIIVENGVISIGEFAFDGCKRTKKVTVADSVQEIKRYAFYDGWLIMDLYLGNGVKKIGERAFDYSGETSEGEYRQLIIYYRGTKNHKEQIAIAEPGFEGLYWWEYVIDETLIKEDNGKWYYYICGRKENANTLVKFKDTWFYV